MGKEMKLFRPVPHANKKEQFGQVVEILLFYERQKRWHMRKNSPKAKKKNTKKKPGKGGGTREKKQKGRSF